MRSLFLLAVFIWGLSVFGGCLKQDGGAAGQAEAQRTRLAELEKENGQLREEVAVLKEELAKARQTGGAAQPATTGSPALATPGAPGEPTAAPATAPPPPAGKRFDDIDGVFGQKQIEQLAELGVFANLAGKFNPSKPATRAEFVRWLVLANNAIWEHSKSTLEEKHMLRLAEDPPATFQDVPETHPDFKYIQGMCNAGFVIGYDEKTFRPDRLITREEMIAIKIGHDTQQKMETGKGGQVRGAWGWTDAEKVADKYTGAVYYDSLSEQNIPRVFGSLKTFNPQKTVTRAEAAVCVWKMGGYPNPTAELALKNKKESP